MKSFFRMMFASMIGTGLAFAMVFMFFLVSIVGMVGASQNNSWQSSLRDTDGKSILHIDLNGPLVERVEKMDIVEGIFRVNEPSAIGLYELIQTLKKASQDEKIKGAFLNMRNFAAGWGHIESLRREIGKFKDTGRFVIAYGDSYNERSFALTSIADEVILYPRGFFEWDGVAAQLSFYKRGLDKWDVVPEIFRAGKYKSAIEPLISEKMSEPSREQIKALIGAIWESLSKKAAEKTQVEADKLDEWANNASVIYAKEALEKGFVTHLASYEEVETKLMELTGDKEEPGFYDWGLYYKQNVKDESGDSDHKVAVIFADGEIIDGEGERGQIGSHTYSAILREIAKEEDIKAVVLRVNSPGGSALASDVMWTSTQFVKDKKPIVASFGNVAASGGYYMSAGANHIMAEETTITGSIGVFGVDFTTEKFWNDTIGVTFDTEKTHLMSDMEAAVRPLTSLEKRKMQNVVDQIYGDFLKVVAQGRNNLGTVEDVHEVAQGRVWAALDAKDRGLVDEYGGLEEAIAKSAELANITDYEVITYPREKNPFEEFFSQLGEVSIAVIEGLLPERLVQIYQKFHQPKTKFKDRIFTRMPYDMVIQ